MVKNNITKMADFLNVRTINSDDDLDILDEDEDIDEKDKVSAICFNYQLT